MEKRASNTFVGGLVTDRHPLTSQNTELIEAQNIDLMAVGEGYQLVLQKREGNEQLMYDDDNLGLINAGLGDTYIPLAVKEFNNIAYIVSVDPTTSPATLELGTFPSPDYTLFEFVLGEGITNGATVEFNVWDADADSYEYSFSLDSTNYSGVDVEIDGNAGWPDADPNLVNETPSEVISTAGFVLTNTGAVQDTLYITVDYPTGASAPEIRVDGSIATEVTLNAGESSTITFRVINPYLDTPIDVHELVATVTPLNGSTASIKTFTFHYHTTIAFMVKKSSQWGTWWTPGSPPDPLAKWFPGTWGDSTNIPAAGASTYYDWQSNYSVINSTNITFVPLAIDPIIPGPWAYESLEGATQFKVYILANEGSSVRTAEYRLAYDTIKCDIFYMQLAP
jgi:hypothetical protein